MWKLVEDQNIHVLDTSLHYQIFVDFFEKAASEVEHCKDCIT